MYALKTILWIAPLEDFIQASEASFMAPSCFQCKFCFLQRKNTSHQSINHKETKEGGPRTRKAWLAIFLYLTYKVIRIEVVSDLTNKAFKRSFKDLYSDKRTTFHGSIFFLTT